MGVLEFCYLGRQARTLFLDGRKLEEHHQKASPRRWEPETARLRLPPDSPDEYPFLSPSTVEIKHRRQRKKRWHVLVFRTRITKMMEPACF